MKIALLGYGRMGKEIEKIALDRGHEIVLKIDDSNPHDLIDDNLKKADVAIDFSIPDAAYSNIKACFDADTPIVCGTTGWLDKFEEVISTSVKEKKGFFYASNFSIGVNVFFKINEYLARIMNKISGYQVSMEEIHHIHKLDAPSGTAITLANGVISEIENKKSWILDQPSTEEEIGIKAIREKEVPGTHSINYDSEVDSIDIKHTAKSRKGFALSAVLAAEYMNGRKGYHTMDDMLDIN